MLYGIARNKKRDPNKKKLTICTIPVPVDREDTNSTLIAHALFGNAYDPFVVFTERYPLDGSWELPFVQAFPCLDGPESEHVVCGTGDEETRLG